MENNSEQFVEKMLKTERDSVVPPRALLHRILGRIPATASHSPVGRSWFSYLRIAIPVGAVAFALLISILGRQTRTITTTGFVQAFDAGAILAEEQTIASTMNDMNQYFDQEASMTEIDTALATF